MRLTLQLIWVNANFCFFKKDILQLLKVPDLHQYLLSIGFVITTKEHNFSGRAYSLDCLYLRSHFSPSKSLEDQARNLVFIWYSVYNKSIQVDCFIYVL